MNKKTIKKIVAHFEERAKKMSLKLPAQDYSVNYKSGQDYPRDIFPTVESAINAMVYRGEGFFLGAGFEGPWSSGNSAGTGDIGMTITNSELLKLVLEN